MTEELKTPANDADSVKRKPRLVLMGEFSAGKSTLTNILLDNTPLPMRVTATRLPPVQVTYGAPAAFAVDKQGNENPIELDDIESVSLDETAWIRVQMQSDVLQLCDLVDMPGISDPNMPHDIWGNAIEASDNVIWCTHATQAWRQSEAAIWKILKEQTSGQNLLLITQFDKLQNERDKKRVLKRVERETAGLFDAIYPVALLEALQSDNDSAAWAASGAAALSEHVIRILMERDVPETTLPTQNDDIVQNDLRNTAALRAFAEAKQESELEALSIVPRRISTNSGGQRRRRVMPGRADIAGE